ncbi:MAG: hypothetical protein NTX00_00695 [Candidatus Parcubacteria bacterium]|nr:hypothetical protein [Candidatus Parcubacteria bacterium]
MAKKEKGKRKKATFNDFMNELARLVDSGQYSAKRTNGGGMKFVPQKDQKRKK